MRLLFPNRSAVVRASATFAGSGNEAALAAFPLLFRNKSFKDVIVPGSVFDGLVVTVLVSCS